MNYFGTVRTYMRSIEELPPPDSRSTTFDINRELRRTVVDIIRGAEPTTIMGILLAHREGVTLKEIADTLDQPVGLVGWNVEKLENDYLCIRVAMEGVRKVIPIASYIDRNE